MARTFWLVKKRESDRFIELGSISTIKAVTTRLGKKKRIEAVGVGKGKLVDSDPIHGFVNAVHHAYALDLPLTISPDDLWLVIAQGLSQHINVNAENLRSRFVSHDGKVEIRVRRDEFVRSKGQDRNDWPGVFHEFSDQIADYIGLIVSSIFVEVAKFHNPVRDFDLRGPPAGYWDLVWD